MNDSIAQDPSRNVGSNGPQRNRSQLSCTSCRSSKLKCDRKSPCSQCMKKGKAAQCIFPTPLARRKPAVSMQNRLKHLESLVKNAMVAQSPVMQSPGSQREDLVGSVSHSRPHVSPTDSSDPKGSESTNSNTGQVVQGSNEYVGATHWAAIFENIEEMQSYFDEAEDQSDHIKSYSDLSFNARSPATKYELLAALPERFMVDRLVSLYFNSNSPALQIIHKPTFQNQYQKFWADLEGTPVAWLGLLFAILGLANAAIVGSPDLSPDNGRDPTDLTGSYRECCVQCLLLSDYTRPGMHTIETLSIYMEGEFLLSKDDSIHCFLLVGNVVRLAMRMGLHRDPSKVGKYITPFQGEMRRRMWHHLVQIDLLSSYHVGLPGMTQAVESDTQYPSNLRDEDFDENSTDLPEPRPDSEFTPMTYTRYKSKLCNVAAKIAAIANRLTAASYNEVMILDEQLQAIHSETPPFFTLGSHTFITDSSERVVRRFSIAMLYLKSRCLLHRSFLLKAKEHPEYAFSRRVGLEAAIELLKCQSMVSEAARPGGALSKDRWFLSSLSMHDFLLAAMIIYMSVMQSFEVGISAEDDKVKEKVACLSKSYVIWTQHWINTFEAKKAASILAGMLSKVRITSERGTASAQPSHTNGASNQYYIPADSMLNLLPGDPGLRSDAFHTTEPLAANWASSDSTSPSSGLAAPPTIEVATDIPSLEGLVDFPEAFDWALFENELRPPQTTDQIWPDFTEDFFADSSMYS